MHDYTLPNFDITKVFTPLQMFQYYDKYSKFLWDKGRRETWEETVVRTVDFLRELSSDKLDFEDYQEMFSLIYTGDISPSMRLFAHAGPAIRRNNEMIYNCSYHVLDSLDAFSEFQWLSMCGCGIATSVEKKFVDKLPKVSYKQNKAPLLFTVADTAVSWKEATDVLIKSLWLHGMDVEFDYSLIRKAGMPLLTKGGYSSGPDILIEIHEYIRLVLKRTQGRKINTLEAFDLFTKIPEAGISGGMRRAAALCLIDHDDDKIINSKYDGFWQNREHAHRSNANISAVWPETVSYQDVYHLTQNLFNTGSGEPGIFKRDNAINSSPERRIFRHPESLGTNACGEIYLESTPVDFNGGGGQFCNLSTVVCKPTDSINSLLYKTRYATLIGDIQSLATDFSLRPEWKKNCELDRLLGVNHIGHAVCPAIRNPENQRFLRTQAIRQDKIFSIMMNTSISASITAVKPSGNSSVLYNTGPGINPVHDRYSKRNVTVSKNTAMFNFLSDYAVAYQGYEGKPDKVMFGFPYQAPKQAILLSDQSAIDQLNYWKMVKQNLVEHNPSCSIVFDKSEQDDIVKWLYDNQKIIGGLALFPHYDNSYDLCPIQKITKEQYDQLVLNMPEIDWSILASYESKDETIHTLECAGGRCDIV